MFLTELLKKPFLKQPEDYNINVHPKKVQKDLTSDDDFINYRAFFDVVSGIDYEEQGNNYVVIRERDILGYIDVTSK